MRTLQIELIHKGLTDKMQKLKDTKRHSKKQMSRQEIDELMGTKRQTYRRVRGAFRSK